MTMPTLLPRAQNLYFMLLKIFNIMYFVVAKLDVFQINLKPIKMY